MGKNKVFAATISLLIFYTGKAQSFSNFEKDIGDYVRILKLPTLAVGVARGDSLIFFTSIGSASADRQLPITPGHIFTVSSVTKSFTSVILQQLEAEGKLSMDDLVDSYPNKYFTKERWTPKTTLAHIISQTSESDPVGTNFVYNGSKYNIVFNVFIKINPPVEGEPISRPFTKELENRILKPLQMSHTIANYDKAKDSLLLPFAVPTYKFIDSSGQYTASKTNLSKMECGPGYGMMSSVSDLVKYSAALDKEKLISKKQFAKITHPFYAGSVYGQGWFTSEFEGIKMDWAYGYGSNDAAIFLKVPSRNLTFILLSSCSMPSASISLGFGNPLNSPVVCSFIRNFILNQPAPLPFDRDPASIVSEVKEKTKQTKSRIYIEEAYAFAGVALSSRVVNEGDKEKNIEVIKLLMKNYPVDPIWQTTAAIELMSSVGDTAILNFGANVTSRYLTTKSLHPAKLYFSGVIQEKLNKPQTAMTFFNLLADGEAYKEQSYKFKALMKLAKYYEKEDTELTKHYLSKLIRYKEYISAQDSLYKEAKEMISKL